MTDYYRFTATGRGHFPVDMLRYDHCWPSYTEDAVDMTNYDTKCDRIIRLISHSEPTPERWASFGWTIELEERG
jgi:hypothetical protein